MANRVVDLRSDTVTQPTEKMRLAMQQAEVGDSQKGEDPSINRLQQMAADLLGKEAAVYVPSGTMSNLVAVMAHCRRGDRVVLGQLSHVYNSEFDGIAVLGGLTPRPVPDPDGIPDPGDVEAAIDPRSASFPCTGLLCLENTHNWAGGAVATLEEMRAVAAVAHRYDIPVHLDGARIFNAAIALKVEPREVARDADSVSFCLSKGLSAPVGSVLCGSKPFIQRAQYFQKILGGAMRQAGHMAAAGIVALEEMIPRLEEDHRNARYLGELLAGMPVIRVTPTRIESNMVIFDLDQERMTRDRFMEALEQQGVRVSASGRRNVRMVTHRHISREDVEYAAAAVRQVVGA